MKHALHRGHCHSPKVKGNAANTYDIPVICVLQSIAPQELVRRTVAFTKQRWHVTDIEYILTLQAAQGCHQK